MSEPTLRSLETLARDAREGFLQLPKFQRDYKWDKRRTCLLLDSIRRRFPIGGMLALRYTPTLNIPSRPFRHSLLESNGGSVTPRELVLDGQQRLTSTMMLLYGVGEHEYFYNLALLFEEWKQSGASQNPIEIEKFSSRMNPEDFGYINRRRSPKKNKSAKDELVQKHILPVKYCREDTGELDNLLDDYKAAHPDRKTFINLVFKPHFTIKPDLIIPIDVITHHSLEALTRIFSTLNKTGLQLTPFEIAISQLAPHNIDPRDDKMTLDECHPYFKNLDVDGDLLLQTILFFEGEDHSKGSLITRLRPEHYRWWYETAALSLNWVGETLQEKVGIPLDRNSDWLVYPNIAIPMAHVYNRLRNEFPDEKKASIEKWKRKFMIWWISGVLTRKYQQGYYTTHGTDKDEFYSWIAQDGPIPQWLKNEQVNVRRFFDKAPSSAAGKCFSAFLSAQNLSDPYTGKLIGFAAAEGTHVHHIFPKTLKANQNTIPETKWKGMYNVMFNTMLVSNSTNALFRNEPPSAQIEICLQTQPEDKVKSLYASQFINDKCWKILRSGEFSETAFNEFVKARAECFAERLKSSDINAVILSSVDPDDIDEDD